MGIGGKRTLKISDLMGTVIVPFHKLESDEDFEWLGDLATEILATASARNSGERPEISDSGREIDSDA